METQEKGESKIESLNEIDEKIKAMLDELQSRINDPLFSIFYHRHDDKISVIYRGHDNGHILEVKLLVRYSEDEKFVADVFENHRDILTGVPPTEAIHRFENIAHVINGNQI